MKKGSKSEIVFFFPGSERSFVNIGSKSFKRRYCYLRQEVDGTYILVMYKDEKKGEAKMTIVMDFCTDVVKVNIHVNILNVGL